MYITFQRFLYYKTEMRTLGAITIKIFTLVLMFFKSRSKHGLCFFYLHTNLGQVGQFHRCAVFGNQRFQIKTIEIKIAFIHFYTFLGKIKSLFDEVEVGICHSE